MFGFESSTEKRNRIEELDRKNALRKMEATKKGMPFFSIRYEDDSRSSEERESAINSELFFQQSTSFFNK